MGNERQAAAKRSNLIRLENGECIEKDALSVLTRNIAENTPGGLPYQPWAAELVKKRMAEGGTEDPHSKCLPPNFPRAFTLPHIQKFVQAPGLLVILDNLTPAIARSSPTAARFGRPAALVRDGYSTGHWEGRHLGRELDWFPG